MYRGEKNAEKQSFLECLIYYHCYIDIEHHVWGIPIHSDNVFGVQNMYTWSLLFRGALY